MEDAASPKSVSSKSRASGKRKLPSAQELISHYESQGLDSQAASLKVIEDLQKALFGVISSGRGKKDRLLSDSSRKIDALNARLTLLDMKLDSKPGYPQSFAIGLASGAALNAILGALAHICKSVSAATNSESLP